jgi:hypothetical protein
MLVINVDEFTNEEYWIFDQKKKLKESQLQSSPNSAQK